MTLHSSEEAGASVRGRSVLNPIEGRGPEVRRQRWLVVT